MEWWQKLFNSQIYFELYEESDTRKAVGQVADIIRLLELKPPARVLDVPCGYGRHAVEFARRGFSVTAVDASEIQIAHGREKAKAAEVDVDFRVMDARRLEFESEFDLAINMFLSFGYFESDGEHLDMLRGIANALRPGGQFLMETWNREYEIRYFDKYQVDHSGDVVEVEEWEFDHLKGRLNWTNTAFFPDGRRESWWHSIRAYTLAELRILFEQAGLRLDAVYGGLKREQFSIQSEDAVLVATRV